MNIVSPFLEEKIKDWPPEKQDEARRGFGEFLNGVVQSLVGNVRRGFVNKFLDAIGPVEKIKIEFVADQIVEAKDSNRFRSKTLIGLVSAFESGIKYAVEAAKRGEKPSGIIEELHKNVLTSGTQKAIEEERNEFLECTAGDRLRHAKFAGLRERKDARQVAKEHARES